MQGLMMPIIDGVDTVCRPCELCDHCFGETHRLVPGCWEGSYESDNVISLCPNHHKAIHFMMAWYYCQSHPEIPFVGTNPAQQEFTQRRLSAYQSDRELRDLWIETVKPIVKERLIAEGRYHPYLRTLPSEPKFVIPRG